MSKQCGISQQEKNLKYREKNFTLRKKKNAVDLSRIIAVLVERIGGNNGSGGSTRT